MGSVKKRAQRQAKELQNKRLKKANKDIDQVEIDELNGEEEGTEDGEEEGTEEGRSDEGGEEEEEEEEEEVSEVPKNKKVLHSEPTKVLIMIIFFQIEFSTDALFV